MQYYEICRLWRSIKSYVEFIRKKSGKINLYFFLTNPSIFVNDYEAMKENKNVLNEELIQKMFHPRNIENFEGWGFSTE